MRALERNAASGLGKVFSLFEMAGRGAHATVSPFRMAGQAAGGFIGRIAGGLAVFGLAANGLERMGQLVTSLKDKMIGGNIQMENYVVGFEVLLKSEEKAAARMRELSQFAALTPFALPEITAGSITLQALAGDYLAVGKGLEMVGNAAAQAKLVSPDTDFQQVSNLVGRVFSGVKAGGANIAVEMQRLSELGILSQETKRMVMAAAESKDVAPDEMWKWILGDFDKLQGMMLKQSVTFAGMSSTLGDNVTSLRRRFGERIFDVSRSGLKDLVALSSDTRLEVWAARTGDALGGKLQTALTWLTTPRNVQGLRDIGSGIGDFVGGGLEKVKAIGGAVYDNVLNPIFSLFRDPATASGMKATAGAFSGLGSGLVVGALRTAGPTVVGFFRYLASPEVAPNIRKVGDALGKGVAWGFDAITTAGRWALDNVIAPAWKFFTRDDIKAGILDGIVTGWTALTAVGVAVWENALKPFGVWLADPGTGEMIGTIGRLLIDGVGFGLGLVADNAGLVVGAFVAWKGLGMLASILDLAGGLKDKLLPALREVNKEQAKGAGGRGGGAMGALGPAAAIGGAVLGVGLAYKEYSDSTGDAKRDFFQNAARASNSAWADAKSNAMSLSAMERRLLFDVSFFMTDADFSMWLEGERTKLVEQDTAIKALREDANRRLQEQIRAHPDMTFDTKGWFETGVDWWNKAAGAFQEGVKSVKDVAQPVLDWISPAPDMEEIRASRINARTDIRPGSRVATQGVQPGADNSVWAGPSGLSKAPIEDNDTSAKREKSAIKEAIDQSRNISGAITEWVKATGVLSTFTVPSNFRAKIAIFVESLNYAFMEIQKVALRYAQPGDKAAEKTLDYFTNWLGAARSSVGLVSDTAGMYKEMADAVRPQRSAVDAMLADQEYIFNRQSAAAKQHSVDAIALTQVYTEASQSVFQAGAAYLSMSEGFKTYEEPSRAAVDSSLAVQDYISRRFIEYAATKVPEQVAHAKLVGEGVSTWMGALSGGLSVIQGLPGIANMPTSYIDSFFTNMDALNAYVERRADTWASSVNEKSAKTGQQMSEVFGGLTSVTSFLGGVAEQKEDVRGQINLMFANADQALRLFEVWSSSWKTENMDRSAKIGRNLQDVFGGITAVFEPITMAADAGEIADYQIDAAMTNAAHLLTRVTQLMRAPEFSGSWGMEARQWSQDAGSIFSTIKTMFDVTATVGSTEEGGAAGNLSGTMDTFFFSQLPEYELAWHTAMTNMATDALTFGRTAGPVFGGQAGGLVGGGSGAGGGGGNNYTNCIIVQGGSGPGIVIEDPNVERIIAEVKSAQTMKHGAVIGASA